MFVVDGEDGGGREAELFQAQGAHIDSEEDKAGNENNDHAPDGDRLDAADETEDGRTGACLADQGLEAVYFFTDTGHFQA